MFYYNSDVLSILQPRVEKELLAGYLGGAIIDGDKLYGATLVDLSKADHKEFEYIHDQLRGYSSGYTKEGQTEIHNLENNTYQSKPLQQRLDEGVYKYLSIAFLGVCFENEWYILPNLKFYGEAITKVAIEDQLMDQAKFAHSGNDPMFKPYEPFTVPINGKLKTIYDHTYKEFAHMPYLVAMLKHDQKEKVNNAFVKYINTAFIIPFFERQRIRKVDEYQTITSLRDNYTMIFPQHKKFTLFCCLAQTSEDLWKLHYFLLDLRTEKFYKWTYFESQSFANNHFYDHAIINDLKQISHWNDRAYLDSSCTLDDEYFWRTYVFAQKENGYAYLKPI